MDSVDEGHRRVARSPWRPAAMLGGPSTSSLRSRLTQATFICRLLIVEHDVLARHGFAAKSATEDRSDIGTARRVRQGRVRFRRA